MADRPQALTDSEVQALCLLAQKYNNEASLCWGAKAYLACCIMLGAAIEAILTALTSKYYDDALKTGKAPKYKHGERKGQIRDLLDWHFFDLLKVATAAKWLPKDLTLDERADCRKVKTPLPTHSIRDARNLVHPAVYFKARTGKEYTDEELSIQYAACHAVLLQLQQLLLERLGISLPKTQSQEPNQSPPHPLG